MNIGIIGLPQTGKRTIFELLVGHGVVDHRDAGKTARGVAEVQDPRFDRMVEMYHPKKESRARIDVVLPPKIEERSISEGDIFRDLNEVDVFCHVVRAFENDAVYHVSGSIDPIRDIDFVNTEFILHDLMFLEKRIERLERDLGKRRDDAGQRELDILVNLRNPLEQELPLRVVGIGAEEEKIIRSYPLLSRREMIVVINVADSGVSDSSRLDALAKKYAASNIKFVQVAARMESEIASLESDEERKEFMAEMGIRDTALHVLTAKAIEALGLISFFTCGPTEVHQWFVRRDASAVEAAGKIHSDLARGFIRAEVIRYADLVELGSEDKVKSAGKLGVKGRDYVVQDGDILFIRFSV